MFQNFYSLNSILNTVIFSNLTLIQIIPLLICATIAGFIDSIGGGGGLISTPAFMAAGIPLEFILGTNKGMAALGSFAAFNRYRKAKLFPKLSAQLWLRLISVTALCAILGAFFASFSAFVNRLHLLLPIVIFLILIYISWRWWGRQKYYSFLNKETPELSNKKIESVWHKIAGIGFYDGLFGPGTGTFFLALFESIGMPTLYATALSKVFNTTSNIGALLFFACKGTVIWPVSLAAAACYWCGNHLGAGLTIKNGPKLVRPVVVIMTSSLLIKLFFNAFNNR